MTEEEAINSLTAQVLGEAPQEESPTEEAKQNPSVEAKEDPREEPKEPEVKIDVAAIIKQATEQQSKLFDEKLKAMQAPQKQEEPPDEEQMMVQQAREKLGIDMQLQEQMKQMVQRQQQMEALASAENEFKKEFPDIDLKEMGEWAEKNNLMPMLSSMDVNQWRVIGNAMKMIAKSNPIPDPVTATAQKGAETTVWDKQKKGEEVSQEEIGAELLKKAGLL